MKKEATISLETARAMYEQGGAGKAFALENFTEQELTNPTSTENKTAVELFALELYEKGLLKGNGDEIQESLELHKQMEKEQMENVFKEAQECAVKADGVYFKHESFDKLYNETYGDNNDN